MFKLTHYVATSLKWKLVKLGLAQELHGLYPAFCHLVDEYQHYTIRIKCLGLTPQTNDTLILICSALSHQVCLCLFYPAGDRLADSTITLALALELLSHVTTPLPSHPIPTWSPSRSNQKVDWMWPSPSGCWCMERYQNTKQLLSNFLYFQLSVRG